MRQPLISYIGVLILSTVLGVAACAPSAVSPPAPAAPAGAQVKDDCKSLTIDNAGVKGSSGTTTNGNCW